MVVPSTPAARQDICKTDGNSITILVDSGASEHYRDIDLHPGLRERMLDYKILKEPHQIITPGEHVIEGIAKGTIIGTFNGQHGEKQQVAFSAIAVPGLGRHLFSPLVASRMGVVTIFDSAQPRLEMGDVTVPMKRLDHDTTFCSVSLELDNSTNTAIRAESADLWHRRLRYINSRSLDLLRKVEGNGIDYTRNAEVRCLRNWENRTTSSPEVDNVRHQTTLSTRVSRPNGAHVPPGTGRVPARQQIH